VQPTTGQQLFTAGHTATVFAEITGDLDSDQNTASQDVFQVTLQFSWVHGSNFVALESGHSSYLDNLAIRATGQPALSNVATISIVVQQANNPPAADAGENVQIPSEDQVYTIIQGTASDPDGGPLQYRWLEGAGVLLDWSPCGVSGEANLDLGSLSYLDVGNHTLTLEVREADGEGLSASDDMVLTIQNSPPEAQPAPSQQIVEIGIDPIVIIADVADFDGDTVTYEWLKDAEVLASGTVDMIQGGDTVAIPDLVISAGDSRFPVGTHAVELGVSDGINSPVTASVSVEVIDTTAPSLSPIPSVTILWPPNHELQPVTIQANAYDNGGGAVTLGVIVESSELPDTDGDGSTIPDFYVDSVDDVTGIIELRLRSERSGKGDGRSYTITISAADESANQSVATVEIRAPHDRRKK